MSTSQDLCPVCRAAGVTQRRLPDKDAGDCYTCPNCGVFFVAYSTSSQLYDLSTEARAILSHQIWLNQTNDSAEPYRVSFTHLGHLKDHSLPDPAEQLDLLIRYFGQKQKGSPGSLVKENFLNLRAKIGALSGDDVLFISRQAL